MRRELVVDNEHALIVDSNDHPDGVTHLIVGPWGPWRYPYVAKSEVVVGDVIYFLNEEHLVKLVRSYPDQAVTVVVVG